MIDQQDCDGTSAPEGRSPLDDMDKDEWLDWFEALSENERIERRAQIMIVGLRCGYTLQRVGEFYGVSRERVRQIVREKGVVTSELRKEQKEQAARHRLRILSQIYKTSVDHPEFTLFELAEAVDVDEPTVRRALGSRLPVHDSEAYGSSQRGMSHEELLDALRRWGCHTSTLTGEDYTKWALECGVPGRQTIAIRFGSWNAAMELAGFGEQVGDRGGTRPQISDEELWATVLEFFRLERPSYSFEAYDEFVRAKGFASGPTLRNRFGRWSEVKKTVHALLRYAVDPDGTWDLGNRVLELSLEDAQRNFVTKDASRAALIRVSERVVGPLTVALYEESRDVADPRGGVVMTRHGSWAAALADAGLEERMSAKARYRWAHYRAANETTKGENCSGQ